MQPRAVQTHQDLLQAARKIFAQDGFEAARLEDIAKAAGKTRGALYAHFRDKEDLFFALIEDDMARDRAIYLQRLRLAKTAEDRVGVITSQLEKLLRDRSRFLLYLEFKMYVLRHPQRQRRLASLHTAICTSGATAKLDLMPEMREQTRQERRRSLAIFGAALDGLALNRYFDPGGLPWEEIHRRLERLVREQMRLD